MKKLLIGLITGLANGLFGSGGGTLLVPCLQKYLKIDQHKAHATALCVILPLSIVSIIIYISDMDIDIGMLFKVSLGGVIGGYIGARLLQRISKKYLHIIFGICMLAAAIRGLLR
jgi:hypothetical protein